MQNATLEVRIEGSTGIPYDVSFVRNLNNLKISCSCAAGKNMIHCKHRLALFAGDITQVLGEVQLDLAQKIEVILGGTDVETALKALLEAEFDAKQANKLVKLAKKNLDRVMHQ